MLLHLTASCLASKQRTANPHKLLLSSTQTISFRCERATSIDQDSMLVTLVSWLHRPIV